MRFGKITLLALGLKRFYVALLQSAKWEMLRCDGGNNGLDSNRGGGGIRSNHRHVD